MLVAVMHYNRATSLRLAIESIERNLSNPRVVIFDDGSTDVDAVSTLRELAARYTVFVNRADNRSVYLRGLHANMNAVLEHASAQKIPYIFFMQDDQQIVRTLDEIFFAELTAIFRGCDAISQIIPMFFKGIYTKKMLVDRFGADEERGFYYERAPSYGISDIGITSVDRLVRRNFRFAHGEGASAHHAATLGLRIVQSRNPVLMYTPWPTTGRDLPDMIARLGLGTNPYAYMSQDEVAALHDRPIATFPVAETYLHTLRPLRRPWWYTAVNPHTISEYNGFLQSKAEAGEL